MGKGAEENWGSRDGAESVWAWALRGVLVSGGKQQAATGRLQ